jgi:hypothetical protein
MAGSDSKKEHWTDAIPEIAAAAVLSAAALLTSWASFQATLWDGEQAANYARAGAARTKASALATQSGQGQAVDVFLFTQWVDAYAHDDTRLQSFYRKRFRPEFATAFDAWLASRPAENANAPPTPFAMAQYVPRNRREAAAMDASADTYFTAGQHANDVSDHYVQVTVIFALALFLGGIGQTFHRQHLPMVFSGMAGAACILGTIKLIGLPAATLGS